MNVTIAGGYEEHGRTCFFVKGEYVNFLFDCGLMPGDYNPYPRLGATQIQKVDYLFLSHSHADHTGAYNWLLEQGFSGTVIMTEETSQQLSFVPCKVYLIDKLSKPKETCIIDDTLTVVWGKSGHCAGSIWYHVKDISGEVLFSGDYVESSLVYSCDYITNMRADTAILDSTYGVTAKTGVDYRQEFVEKVKELYTRANQIILPVPKYGRGLDFMLVLESVFPKVPLMIDTHLYNELSRIDELASWIRPGIISKLREISKRASVLSNQAGFVFLSDPQLKSKEAQLFLKSVTMDSPILLSGHVDKGSLSEELLRNKRAVHQRYAVHMSNDEREQVERRNDFSHVIPYHREV